MLLMAVALSQTTGHYRLVYVSISIWSRMLSRLVFLPVANTVAFAFSSACL